MRGKYKMAVRPLRPRHGRQWRADGFTLIEMLVTIVLVGIGIAGVFGGIRALALAETKARTVQRLQSLAIETLNTIGPITDSTSAATSGNYSDEGYPDASYTVDVETTDTENLSKVTVTATEGNEQQSVTSLLYIPPTTGSTTGTTGTTGGSGT